MADKFPGDLSGEIAALRAEVDELKALIKNRPALTKASTGWRMTDMASPSVPDGEIHIGANGGDLYVATASDVKRITSITKAASPTFPPSFDSPATVGGTTTPSSAYNLLRADCATLQACLRNTNQRGAEAGVWES